MPITVQLIGTDDDYIAPTDNIDLATSNQNFFYLEVPKATHRGIVRLANGEGGEGAKTAFRTALTAKSLELKCLSLKREDVFDLFDESVDTTMRPARRPSIKGPLTSLSLFTAPATEGFGPGASRGASRKRGAKVA